jgi:hypothetical protein
VPAGLDKHYSTLALIVYVNIISATTPLLKFDVLPSGFKGIRVSALYFNWAVNPMSADPSRKPFSGFRNPLLYTSMLLLIALVYVGGTFYVRRQQSREIEKRAADAAAAKERTNDALTVEQLGGSEFKILNFYATPPVVHAGETVQLCYGVSNAKTVKLEPQTNPIWLSVSRCVDVTPKKTTEYTLTIEDGNGNSKTSTLTVQVR